jgi:hypothetical protein
MSRKFISLATALVTLDVYLRSQLSSNDPLFLFASNKLIINAGLMMLTAFVVALSFREEFKGWLSYIACIVAAALFAAFGIMGFFFSDSNYPLSNFLLPFDCLILLESSVVMGICCLTYSHAKVPASHKLLSLWLAIYKLRFIFPIPKIPHSPYNATRGLGTGKPA